ncbi:putative Ig domain-containing protein [Tropheryma whipplei]|uniref:putative Ig domain-containing protein n=1 Tax=Tropheryma whipplei TaxID=2039 RepID=UPI00130508A6
MIPVTLDSSGTITGSIDTSVTPGEYKVSFYAFAAPVEARVTAYRLCHRSSNYCVINNQSNDCYLYHRQRAILTLRPYPKHRYNTRDTLTSPQSYL